jgi:hypothetical protein
MSDAERRNAEHNQSPRTQTPRRNYVLFALALTAVIGMLLLAIPVSLLFWSPAKGSHEARYKYCQKQLDEQIAEIRHGKDNFISLYDSVETDRLLEQLVDVPGISSIELQMTDVTDAGMKSLAAVKNLKWLAIEGGRPGVGDEGFSHIKTISALEELKMVNTRISDRSLPGLKSLPNLQSLTLAHSVHYPTQFTAAGLQDLKALKKLKKLNVTGGLASDDAIKELRSSLPNCAINEDMPIKGIDRKEED